MLDPHAPLPDLDPVLDIARLQEIADLDLFAPDVGAILNDLVHAASERLGLPLAMVKIVLDEAQFTAAHHGLGGWIAEAQGTPVEWAFCRFVVRDRGQFVIEDTFLNEQVKNNPLVTIDGLRCYAGVPLMTSRGHVLGSFCVAGPEPHRFSEQDMKTLHALGAEAVRRIEKRRLMAA